MLEPEMTNQYSDEYVNEEYETDEVEEYDSEEPDSEEYDSEEYDDQEDIEESPDLFQEPPEEFDDVESELEFYRNNYNNIYDKYTNDDFVETIKDIYAQDFLQSHEEAEQVLNLYNALKSDDKVAVLREYAPEILEGYTQQQLPSEDDIIANVENKMKEAYGEDWKDYYNERDAVVNPRSDSFKMKRFFDNEINKSYQELESMKENIQQPMTEDEVYERFSEIADSELQELGDDFNNDDVFEMYEELRDYQPSVSELYAAKNLDSIIDEAVNEGIQRGIQMQTEKIRNAGSIYRPDMSEPPKENNSEFNLAKYYSNVSMNNRGI